MIKIINKIINEISMNKTKIFTFSVNVGRYRQWGVHCKIRLKLNSSNKKNSRFLMFDTSLNIPGNDVDFTSLDYPDIILELQKHVPKHVIIPVKITSSWTDLIKQNPAEDYIGIYTTPTVDYLDIIVENIRRLDCVVFTVNNIQATLQRPKKFKKKLRLENVTLLT